MSKLKIIFCNNQDDLKTQIMNFLYSHFVNEETNVISGKGLSSFEGIKLFSSIVDKNFTTDSGDVLYLTEDSEWEETQHGIFELLTLFEKRKDISFKNDSLTERKGRVSPSFTYRMVMLENKSTKNIFCFVTGGIEIEEMTEFGIKRFVCFLIDNNIASTGKIRLYQTSAIKTKVNFRDFEKPIYDGMGNLKNNGFYWNTIQDIPSWNFGTHILDYLEDSQFL